MGCTSGKEDRNGQGKSGMVAASHSSHDHDKKRNENDRRDQIDALDREVFIRKAMGNFYERYEVLKVCGHGTFGKVFQVRNKFTNDLRAAKKMTKDFIGYEEEMLNKFVKDVSILRQIDHPSAIKVFEYIVDEKFLFIVTEYIDGGNLQELMDSAEVPFTESMIKSITRQVLSVLEYAHEKLIVHRDIKPENIMFLHAVSPECTEEQLAIKVIDWGAARTLTHLGEKLDELCGTPYYVAPQIIEKSYDEKCDIWSLGAMVYQLIVGDVPFTGETMTEIFDKILNEKLDYSNEAWARVSPQAKDFVQRTMERDDTKRLSAKDAMNHPWITSATRLHVDETTKQVLKSKLKHNVARSHFIRCVFEYMASQFLDGKQSEEAQTHFRAIDSSGQGYLTADNLVQFFNSSDFTRDDAVNVIQSLDKQKHGYITFSEFKQAVISDETLLDRNILIQTFVFFDCDGDAQITKDDFKNIFHEDEIDHEWQEFLREADNTHAGKVSFEDFERFMQHLCEERNKNQ